MAGVRRKISWFIVGGICSVAMLLSTAFVNAQTQPQESVTLGISPQILDLTANPGDTLTNTFRLTNGSAEPITIQTTPKNFTPLGEEGAVDLTEDKTTYSLAEWVVVSPSTSDVQAGETKDFIVTINVPATAEPGSHFGSVVFQTVPEETEGTAALVSQEIAPVILVKVAGDVRESAEIVEFKSTKGLWSNEPTIDFVSRIKNTGSVHFKPTGRITIKNMFGSEVGRVDLDQRNVLPDSIRQFSTSWQQDGFKIGRYTADLTLVYSDGTEIQTASTSFVIFPYQIVIPVLVILAVVILIIVKFRKRLALAFNVLRGKSDS